MRAEYPPRMVEVRRYWRSTVRISEMGASGRVLPHRVLEWMQEAAAAASTQAGYSPARYLEMQAAWFVREAKVAIDAPIDYEAPIVVETWISTLRRFRSHREYIVYSGDDVVARGQAEWLFVEMREGGGVRPRLPDEAMKDAFPRDAEFALTEEETPAYVEPAAAPTSTDQRRIRPSDIDRNGHVNNVRYLAWLDDHGRLVDPKRDIVFARMEYLLDARPGDRVELSLYETPTGDAQFIHRGDDRIMRSMVRRTAPTA